eukprot:GHVS01014079.1.p1 GENE.GHVS01014079.1~~GHVS01014079.1.p1  ORF type:complete len:264 (-),score=63.74 GHVS01014079.1:346-1032(-)
MVQQQRKALQFITTEFRDAKVNVERLQLFDGALSSDGRSAVQRERLLDVTDTLQEGRNKLEETKRMALETEEIGVSIMGDLSSQRETISRTRNNVGQLSSNLDEARRSITNIARRVMQNRLLLYVIAVTMALALLLILFVKLSHFIHLFSPSSTSSDSQILTDEHQQQQQQATYEPMYPHSTNVATSEQQQQQHLLPPQQQLLPPQQQQLLPPQQQQQPRPAQPPNNP